MTISEIFQTFESEWVLLEDPVLDPNLEVLEGRVVFHGKDRDEVYQKALELRPKRPALLFTGQIPVGTAVIL